MERHGRHGVHVGFGNVLDHNRNIIVPYTDRFVVRSGDKPPIFVNECDRVYRSQMLIILLRDFPRIHIVLLSISEHVPGREGGVTHLNNLLVRHASEKYMLLIPIRMEFYTVWNLAIAETLQALACFGVP